MARWVVTAPAQVLRSLFRPHLAFPPQLPLQEPVWLKVRWTLCSKALPSENHFYLYCSPAASELLIVIAGRRAMHLSVRWNAIRPQSYRR